MLVAYTPDKSVTQKCSRCSKISEHDLRDLRRGLRLSREVTAPNVIVLPECECGAREVLYVPVDKAGGDARGTWFDLHRRVVGSLGVALSNLGLVTTGLEDAVAKQVIFDVLEPGDLEKFLTAGQSA